MVLSSYSLFENTLIKAYYYIVHADGKVDDKEVELGRQMIEKEGIKESDFYAKMEALSGQNGENIARSLKEDLKKLPKGDQVKIIAYMSNAANADGFMDTTEWKMIYNLYKGELNLQLDDILSKQREIPPFG